MASPAFVYAFDNLGPEKFAELCGVLLGSRYKGVVLTAPGPDGGIDAESDPAIAEWFPEHRDAIENTLVTPHTKVVFQIKHSVVGRLGGQSRARATLLRKFRSTSSTPGELASRLIQARKPSTYVLVTNLEVNSIFRDRFIATCRAASTSIDSFQVIGLDELSAWTTMATDIRHLYLPLLFGMPRFQLRVALEEGRVWPGARSGDTITWASGHPVLQVSVMNTGTETSYPAKIMFKHLTAGEVFYGLPFPRVPGEIDPLANPKLGTPLPPGRCQTFHYDFEFLRTMLKPDTHLVEVMVEDEIGNRYSCPFTEDLRRSIRGKSPRAES